MADKIWARLDGDIVVELVTLPDHFIPGVNIFSSDVQFVDVTTVAGIAPMWVHSNGAFAAPQVTAPPASTVAELLAYASTKQNTVLAQVWTSVAPLKLTTRLDSPGQTAMMKLALWGMLNASVSGAVEPYSNVDYSTASMTPSQATQMGTQAGHIVSQSYGTLNTVAEAIQASSPSITSKAQIDAAAWPTP